LLSGSATCSAFGGNDSRHLDRVIPFPGERNCPFTTIRDCCQSSAPQIVQDPCVAGYLWKSLDVIKFTGLKSPKGSVYQQRWLEDKLDFFLRRLNGMHQRVCTTSYECVCCVKIKDQIVDLMPSVLVADFRKGFRKNLLVTGNQSLKLSSFDCDSLFRWHWLKPFLPGGRTPELTGRPRIL